MKRHKTLAEQIANRCKHFTGMQNRTCSAGIKYDDILKSPDRTGLGRWPCFKDEGADLPCEKRAFPTPEEVAESVAESDASFERTIKARKAIIATKKRGGEIAPCPCCGKGRLRFGIASNGHVHAACTAGCVAWME